MDFRSKSIYECTSPVLLRRVQVPNTSVKGSVLTSRKSVDKCTGEIGYKLVRLHQYTDVSSIPLVVRCGKCENCRKYQNDEWAIRMMLETISTSDVATPFFVTLSFNDNFINDLKSVDKTFIYKKYVVPFKKRLRSYGLDFRFYCVSELGEQNGRFHFHLILWVKRTTLLSLACSNFVHSFAEPSLDYFDSVRLFVKGSNGKYRLQTDIECYVQYLIQRAWSLSVQRFSCAPIIKIHYKRGTRVKSVEYPNQIGWVSCSQAEHFGACKYITSYSLKCIHDGVTTYHRQSPGLGKSYVESNIKGSKDMLQSGLSIPDTWTFGEVPVVLPRFFVRKFMPDDLRLKRFWAYYASVDVSQFIELMPRFVTSDNFSYFIEMVPPQYFRSACKDQPRDIWLETLDEANDMILSGRAKKVDVHKLYKKNLKKFQLCSQSKKEELNSSVRLTLF